MFCVVDDKVNVMFFGKCESSGDVFSVGGIDCVVYVVVQSVRFFCRGERVIVLVGKQWCYDRGG